MQNSASATASPKACEYPFYYSHIATNGDVFTCCPAWCNHYSFGNILKEPFEQIWNGEKAQIFRNNILNGDYSICNLDVCRHKFYYTSDDIRKKFFNKNLVIPPSAIDVSHDPECNAACVICRDSLHRNTPEEKKRVDLITSRLVGIIEHCKILHVSGYGDPFGSRAYSKLIKEAARRSPSIRFNLVTNGLLLTEAMAKRLNIENRINAVFLSLHATTEETYNAIVKHSNYKKVLANLAWLAEQKKNGSLKTFHIRLVVNELNYREMPAFVELAQHYGAIPSFSAYRPGKESFNKEKYRCVFNPDHPEYEKFLEVMSHDNLGLPECVFDGPLIRGRKEGLARQALPRPIEEQKGG